MKKILHEFRAITSIYFWFLPPEWFRTPPLDDGVSVSFDPEEYNLAFTIDPHFELSGCISVPPVVNVHKNLIQPPEVIRTALNVPDDMKLALIAHNGHDGEIDEIMKQADIDPDEYCRRSVSSFDDVSRKLFPLSHYMSGVDLAIGGCGYFFFYETKFYKIPSLYFPQTRIGNEQHWRLMHNNDYSGPFNGAEIIVERILDLI